MILLKNILATTFSFLLSILIGLPVLQAESRLDIEYDRQTELLSVLVKNTSLTVVLEEIEKKSNCQFLLFGSNNAIITDSFSGLLLAKGVQRLAKNYSMAVIYRISDTHEDITKRHTTSQIWLFYGRDNTPSTAERSKGNKPKVTRDTIQTKRVTVPEVHNKSNALKVNSRLSSKQFQALNRPIFDDETNVGFWANQLFEGRDYDAKEQSITELQRIGSDDALVAITTALGDEDTRLRRHVVESLKIMDNEKAKQIIGQALLGDPDASVRKAALSYFADHQDPISRSFLNTALKDSDEQIQKLAQKALINF